MKIFILGFLLFWSIGASAGPIPLPTQSGQSGKFLTTNGVKASWSSITPTTSAVVASDINWASLLNSGGLYTKTLSANTTFTFSGASAGQVINIRLTNTASNYTVTWPTVKWSGGTTPTMTTGAKSDIYSIFYDGTSYFGVAAQNF